MGKQQPQHRLESEEKRRNKLLAELKRENHNLRRKVSRLQKRLNQMPEESEHEDEVETLAPEKAVARPRCPVCSSEDLSAVFIPTGKLVCCNNCGNRQKES